MVQNGDENILWVDAGDACPDGIEVLNTYMSIDADVYGSLLVAPGIATGDVMEMDILIKATREPRYIAPGDRICKLIAAHNGCQEAIHDFAAAYTNRSAENEWYNPY